MLTSCGRYVYLQQQRVLTICGCYVYNQKNATKHSVLTICGCYVYSKKWVNNLWLLCVFKRRCVNNLWLLCVLVCQQSVVVMCILKKVFTISGCYVY